MVRAVRVSQPERASGRLAYPVLDLMFATDRRQKPARRRPSPAWSRPRPCCLQGGRSLPLLGPTTVPAPDDLRLEVVQSNSDPDGPRRPALHSRVPAAWGAPATSAPWGPNLARGCG